jgi:hypothetical protein
MLPRVLWIRKIHRSGSAKETSRFGLAAMGHTTELHEFTANYLRTASLGTRRRGPIDSLRPASDDSSMVAPEVQAGSTRRSSRVFTRIPVRAQGKNSQGRSFKESSQTIVINAHGGLLYLQEEVEVGADLVLVNPATDEEQDCRVVYIGDTSEKGTRVGVEFLSPSPHFWGVEFAQEDWHPHGPSTAVH